MIRNVLAALAYYAEGFALVPRVLWALAVLGVAALLLEVAAARSATRHNRALGEGRLQDGSRYARVTLEGIAGEYVRLGTSVEHGSSATIAPTLAAVETRWQRDDGSVLLVPAGTKLHITKRHIEKDFPDTLRTTMRTMDTNAAGPDGARTYDYAVRAGDTLWLSGPLPEPASPVNRGVHRASAQRVLSPETLLFLTAQNPLE